MDQTNPKPARYAPEYFTCRNTSQAREAILNPGAGLTVDERWERETPWIAERLLFPTGPVVDLGCGIGRLARTLVAKDHTVLGVDLSDSMRRQAEMEVGDPVHFATVSPAVWATLVDAGLRASGAMAIWVLQHIPQPVLSSTIEVLALNLVPGAPLYTVDRKRCVPVVSEDEFGWADDGVDMVELLIQAGFTLHWHEGLPETASGPGAVMRRWFRRRE